MEPIVSNNITPVLYLGFNRSGTTWLGNILKESFKIASVSHELHYGVLENSIYSNNRYFKNIKNLDNYIRFVRLFSGTDFFLATGLAEEDFYISPYDNFYSFFLDLMDKYAIKEGSYYWATKLDPTMFFDLTELNIFLTLLNSRYKKIKFICVQREMFAVLKSGLSLQQVNNAKINRRWAFLRQIAYLSQYRHVNNQIKRIIKNEQGLELRYEEMVGDIDNVINKIRDYLNIQASEKKNTSIKTIRNTSYQSRNQPKDYSSIKKMLLVWLSVFFIWPVKLISKIRYRYNTKDFTYLRIIKRQFYPGELRNELIVKGQPELAKILED